MRSDNHVLIVEDEEKIAQILEILSPLSNYTMPLKKKGKLKNQLQVRKCR